MKIKQREANRKALEMAAAMVRDADLDNLFGEDSYDCTDAEEAILSKAQDYAVRRIEALLSRKD